MLPQLGVGGWMPRPRKDSADSARMIWPTARLAATIITGRALGSRWRSITRMAPAPTERVATMNSRDRSDSASARTRRLTLPQPTNAMMNDSVTAFGRSSVLSRMNRKIAGIERMMSTSRMGAVDQPRQRVAAQLVRPQQVAAARRPEQVRQVLVRGAVVGDIARDQRGE